MPAQRLVPAAQVESEIGRFEQALDASRAELDEMANRSGLAEAVGSIAAGHREFLRDPTLNRQVVEAIRNGRTAAEYAVAVVFRRWIEKFRSLDDDFRLWPHDIRGSAYRSWSGSGRRSGDTPGLELI